jgi:hypothetical protein
MDMLKNKIHLLAFCLLFFILLTACTSKLSRANFEKVKPGMTFAEVIELLGSPSSSSTLSFGKFLATTANWENRNLHIQIQFFDGKMKVKQLTEGVTTPRNT